MADSSKSGRPTPGRLRVEWPPSPEPGSRAGLQPHMNTLGGSSLVINKSTAEEPKKSFNALVVSEEKNIDQHIKGNTVEGSGPAGISNVVPNELLSLASIRIYTMPKKNQRIGAGAFSKVYSFKMPDNKMYAGKKIQIPFFNLHEIEELKLKALKQAENEILILHKLNHENIVDLIGYYYDSVHLVIFMELMHSSVKEKIKKDPLSERECVNYAKQAACALKYLHNLRPAVVHRDIKCENLLLNERGTVKLADFGLSVNLAINSASLTQSSTAPSSLAGSYLFMAPEVFREMENPKAYGRKSDIWSLACTIVQMVTCFPPFKKEFDSIGKHQFLAVRNDYWHKYSGTNLASDASVAMKYLLDKLFIVEKRERPSIELAFSIINGIMWKQSPKTIVQELVQAHEAQPPIQKIVQDTPAMNNVSQQMVSSREQIRPPLKENTCDTWMPKKRKTIGKLGEGAFGIIWKCCDTESLRLFVAKETIIKDDESMPMAENEVECLKQLQHEHVTKYYGSVKEKHTIVIYMEYYSAGSLKQLINNVGPLEENTAIMYIRQILNGLAYIHSKLILHCDLKCDDLLLDNRGKVKISDFGVAVQMVLTETNQEVFMRDSLVNGGGTLYWMAPEVIKQENYGRKADVWSLGCTIVEMMTSLPPYRQEYPNETRFMGALSGNRLSYKAEEILPNASITMKIFLSSLLVVDTQKRGFGFDAEKKFNEQFPLKTDDPPLPREKNRQPVDEKFRDTWMPKKPTKIEKLGEGAFSIVWKCCDTESLRLFVAKETIINDDETKAMTENEVECLKQLQHEYVITYYDSVKEWPTIVIYMEYFPAGSLEQMINKVGPLAENTAITYIRQILNGLAYIHSMLIIHCNLKCGTLLLDGQGKIKIGDFSVSVQMVLNYAHDRHQDRVCMQGSVSGGGTLYWMAPEVIKQENYDRKADVWSLGCTIVEMMTSLPPYCKEYKNEVKFMGALSGNRLSYKAEEILPNASITMKNFLSSLLVVDTQKRGFGFDAEKKFNEDFPR